MKERLEGGRLFRSGGSYDNYLEATQNLRKDSLNIRLNGLYNRDGYLKDQEWFMTRRDSYPYDEETGTLIFLPGFDKIMNKISCPVLSVLGEKDSQIDWRRTKTFYEMTIGQNENASLRILTIPNCNHTMQKCRTGGMFEDLEEFDWQVCDGFFESMASWIQEQQ